MTPEEAALELAKRIEQRKFYQIDLYPWQQDFCNGSVSFLQRMLMAGNRTGKTFVAAYEIACHATGIYPAWWKGRRFTHAPLIWISSLTNETLRDIMQLELLGKPGEFGTGMIPGDKIVGTPDYRQAGIKNVVDTFQVRHTSGKVCTVKTKVAEQGWEKYQGTAPDVIWQDEEPNDFKVVTESFTRLMTTDGLYLVTFTPLRGETEIVSHFTNNQEDGVCHVYTATWDDAPHLDKKTKDKFLKAIPEHERETRKKGLPMMGEGAVFPIADEELLCAPIQIPRHWARICGVDFGVNHPAAGAWFAFDRDTDTAYLYDAYRKAKEQPSFHASVIKRHDRNGYIPVVWPHDGINEEKASGLKVAEQYREEGVRMFPFSARYDDDKGSTQAVEPIVQDIYTAMTEGRFKVFDNPGGRLFLEEKRLMHRKDNKIRAVKDDIMKAAMYAYMMRRYALPEYLANRAPRIDKSQPLVTSSRT